MPNLPKPRLRRTARTRGGVATRPSEPERPNVEVVEFASGDGQSLRWINIERPRPADRAWLEDDIFEGERPAEIVRDISNVKQEIINFRRVVRPQRAALKDLEATKRYIPDDLEIYFDDINDASERTWDMLENYKEVVEALESTNEAVLSHRLNDTFRVLTAISVIVLPLTLIAPIRGLKPHG